jgi:transposase
VANTRKLKSISEAKAKTDRLDARMLARLLRSGLLDQVWTPDERTRTLRRLTNQRERLVRARTRAKNETHGVLARTSASGRRSRTRSGRVAAASLPSWSCHSTNG